MISASKEDKLQSFISSAEALCELLREYSELVEEKLKIYKNLKSQGSHDEIENAFEDFMFAQYEYLRRKFDCLWYEDIRFERILQRYAPSIKVFGALDFEVLIQSLLFILQSRSYEITRASHDGGVDLQSKEPFYFGGTEIGFASYFAQCKLYRRAVPVSHVRDFFGVITNEAAEGYFFTSGYISATGKKFIESANKSPYANKFYFADRIVLSRLFDIADKILSLTESYLEIDYGTTKGKETFNMIWEKIENLKAEGMQVMSIKKPISTQQRLFE